jgi:hypothetical protein
MKAEFARDDQAHTGSFGTFRRRRTACPKAYPRDRNCLTEAIRSAPQDPCTAVREPPPNGPLHNYVFGLYALDTRLDVKPSGDAFETRANVMKAIQGHILAKEVYGGLFRHRCSGALRCNMDSNQKSFKRLSRKEIGAKCSH